MALERLVEAGIDRAPIRVFGRPAIRARVNARLAGVGVNLGVKVSVAVAVGIPADMGPFLSSVI